MNPFLRFMLQPRQVPWFALGAWASRHRATSWIPALVCGLLICWINSSVTLGWRTFVRALLWESWSPGAGWYSWRTPDGRARWFWHEPRSAAWVPAVRFTIGDKP